MEKSYNNLLIDLKQFYENKIEQNNLQLDKIKNLEFYNFSDLEGFVKTKLNSDKLENKNRNCRYFIRTINNILEYDNDENIIKVMKDNIIMFKNDIESFSSYLIGLEENFKFTENEDLADQIENLYYAKLAIIIKKEDIVDYSLFLIKFKEILEK